MKRIVAIVLAALAVSTSASAQTTDEIGDRALAAAPRQMREGAVVIKWNPDFTYQTLKKGTNRLVCYDRSGEPGRQPFAVQCPSVGLLDRVAQNRRFEAMTDAAARKEALDAAEANGTRVKPEFESVWLTMNGPTRRALASTRRSPCRAPRPGQSDCPTMPKRVACGLWMRARRPPTS